MFAVVVMVVMMVAVAVPLCGSVAPCETTADGPEGQPDKEVW